MTQRFHRRDAVAALLAAGLGPGLTGSARAQASASAAPPADLFAPWQALLQDHVQVRADGRASRVDYAGLARRRPELQAWLARLSSVSPASYAAWPSAQRLAFLINAYNGFTIDLVLSRYPDLASIKDLGGLLSSPWKKPFFPLLGQTRSLDELEHGLIRGPGGWQEPRVHMALVCASIGCPMLQPRAWVGDTLEAQLDDALRRFLGDRRRNRPDPARQRLQVSRLFDWYHGDFERGQPGPEPLRAWFARWADEVAGPDPAAVAAVRRGEWSISFLEYDWRLNDLRAGFE